MSTRPLPLRLFVAAYPPPEIAGALLNPARQLDLPPHRATPLEQLHLTLQFIGDTAPNQLDAVTESVARAASGIPPFTLTPASIITLPARPPSRLAAAATDAPAPLLELVRRLAHRFARRPRRDSSDRFLPHLTLCRFTPPLPDLAGRSVPLDVPPFKIHDIALMRSVLSAAGARHDLVQRFSLDG